jgi:hypothetical protein
VKRTEERWWSRKCWESSSSSYSSRVRRVSCSLILKMKLVPPSLPQSSYVPSSFGLYCSASFGSPFVSILCTCCSHLFWYSFISFTMFCAPVFCLIHWFFSLSQMTLCSYPIWGNVTRIFPKLCALFPSKHLSSISHFAMCPHSCVVAPPVSFPPECRGTPPRLFKRSCVACKFILPIKKILKCNHLKNSKADIFLLGAEIKELFSKLR